MAEVYGEVSFGGRLEELACSLKHVADRPTEALHGAFILWDHGSRSQTAEAAAGVVPVGAGRGRINDYYCAGDRCRA